LEFGTKLPELPETQAEKSTLPTFNFYTYHVSILLQSFHIKKIFF